ncbi:MAG TPA: hypothetical protein QGF95_26295 [Candidatus Latescibacteria bacterium]|nr:hypothetical protein [Candidatus Latescibacterota bacterium]HJP34074.1 hypothetical protein [Candidatus Latescibacterota bacterium]
MSATDDRPTPVPMWKLERFVLGELPAEELALLRDRVEADADLCRQVETLRQGDADVRLQYPAPWMARQILARAAGVAPARSRWKQIRWSLAPVAAVALLAIVALPGLRDGESTRIKGPGASLTVHRRTADGSEGLRDGSTAQMGDLIRLQYVAAGAAYGAILSVDGRGAVTRHLPLQGDTSPRLETGGITPLETAYELDDAPRWERFFLVTGMQPFSIETVTAAARAAAVESKTGPAPESLDLPEGLEQSALTLIKLDQAPGAGAP